MDMKMDTIIKALPSIEKIMRQDLQLNVAYKLRKLTSKLQVEITFFEETKGKLFDKYEVTFDESGKISIPKQNIDKLTEEYDALLLMEIHFDEDKIICNIAENISVSASDIILLDPFIEFVEV